MSQASTSDRNGEIVRVGARVRVLEITPSLQARVPSHEWHELQEMVGETFEVYEIDEHGAAWVEKVWQQTEGRMSHSIGLDAHEMEVV